MPKKPSRADLTQADENDLKQELIGREADRRAQQNKAQQAMKDLVLANVDTLLLLVPKHDTINCSDENTASGYMDHGRPRCRRCRLLDIKRDGCNTDTVLDVQLLESHAKDNTPGRIEVIVRGRDD
jgi:hypothetical protein